VSDRGVSGGVYKRACATEDQGARLMASGCMVDLFGASTAASDYLVKTEPVLGRWTSLGEDSSDQSLSHRSDGFSEYPASTGGRLCGGPAASWSYYNQAKVEEAVAFRAQWGGNGSLTEPKRRR
jgi:hypothetical protein